MNRSNAGASFDILHIVLDFAVLLLAFLVATIIWGDSAAVQVDKAAILSVYVVCDYLNNDGNRKTASSAVLDDIELRHDYESLMSSRTAKDLIQELNSLPDVWGDETDEIA